MLVGQQEGHPACKKWGDGGGLYWLVRMEWRPARWSVCLPLLISPCTVKSRSSLLTPAHPGGPGKKAVKWSWWWCGAESHITSCLRPCCHCKQLADTGLCDDFVPSLSVFMSSHLLSSPSWAHHYICKHVVNLVLGFTSLLLQ